MRSLLPAMVWKALRKRAGAVIAQATVAEFLALRILVRAGWRPRTVVRAADLFLPPRLRERYRIPIFRTEENQSAGPNETSVGAHT